MIGLRTIDLSASIFGDNREGSINHAFPDQAPRASGSLNEAVLALAHAMH
jgi:hypothetical protein